MAFRVDYTVPAISRDFGTVFIGDKNVAVLVVSAGWAKVERFAFFCSDVPCLDYFFIAEFVYRGFVGAGKRAGATEGRSKSLPS